MFIYRRQIKHSMLRRRFNWNYSGEGIYMITLTLEDRSHPILGNLIIDTPPGTPPEMVQAHIAPTKLRLAAQSYWHHIPEIHPETTILGFQLMGEHLHGIIQVLRKMNISLGNIIAGFKGACTNKYHELYPNAKQIPLFSPGYQDRILFDYGRLPNVLHYLEDNPRRCAIKRLYPNLFKLIRRIPFDGGHFIGIGNHFLLNAPILYQVQASRNISTAEFEAKRQEMLMSITNGAVIVSPCISQGERLLAKHAFEASAPLITLKNKGFSPYFKPSGAFFDACANGRLLMLAPGLWPFVPGKKVMTRNDACILNALCQRICGTSAATINYHGLVPVELELLTDKAIGKNSSP